jgi:lipocalin
MMGGYEDNSYIGAAWVFTRSNGVWTQQGLKLVGTGAVGGAEQGFSVALSADGNTAIVGGPDDNGSIGAAWIYTRSGDVWTQQGLKLVGTTVGPSQQGHSVSLSSDGNTAIVGGPGDGVTGAAWVFIRSNGVWTQQGKLVGTGAVGSAGAAQGYSVSLSGDGNTAIVGGPGDNGDIGAAWVYTRSGGVWTQQGLKLVGTDAAGYEQGFSVALSADGNTAIVGGPGDNGSIGAAWVYTRSGDVWTQQGLKLVGTGAILDAEQGTSVSLSGDGNTAIVGGPNDNGEAGATWVFTRSNGVWTQQGSKLVGTAVGNALQGSSVSLSSDGNTAMVGGPWDNGVIGAAWVFVGPTLQVTPTTNMVAAGNPGGPFTPSSFP